MKKSLASGRNEFFQGERNGSEPFLLLTKLFNDNLERLFDVKEVNFNFFAP
jgi:hypothetical protein